MPNISPVTGQADLRGGQVHRRRTWSWRSTRRTPPRTRWGETSPAARAAVLNAIADAIEANLRDARGRRDVGERQAGARDARRRHPAGRRPLPLLRGAARADGGLLDRDRQGPRRLPLPRAAGRGRADHPVQLPDPDGGVEDGPRAGRRQLHGAQAGVAHTVVDPEVGGGDRATSCRRASSTCITGPGGEIGKALATSPRIAKIAIHRRDHDRPADHAVRGAEPDPVHRGAGRQVAQHLLRRRDGRRRRVPGQGDRGAGAVRVQQGRGVHVPVARADPGVIYEEFMARCLDRIRTIKQGNPLDTDTMLGPQVSKQQLEKITGYVDIGAQEGAEVLIGGGPPTCSTATSPRATSSSRPSSRATTRCGSSRRRSSDPCWR